MPMLGMGRGMGYEMRVHAVFSSAKFESCCCACGRDRRSIALLVRSFLSPFARANQDQDQVEKSDRSILVLLTLNTILKGKASTVCTSALSSSWAQAVFQAAKHISFLKLFSASNPIRSL